jgi:arylsulfatase A-like enzyme
MPTVTQPRFPASRRSFWTFRASPAALLAGLVLIAGQPILDARSPNIIFILVDDLGYGDLGCYGQKTLRTPNIDRLASEGLRFRQFYAGSTVCAPSRCVLMTGLHTGRAWIRGNAKEDLRPEDVTVAEVLKRCGITTGLFGKWGLGHEGTSGLPTRQGFDEFFGYLDQTHAHNYFPSFLVRGEERIALPNEVPNEGKLGQGVAAKRVTWSHDLIANEALSFIERHHARPFFLYLSITLPHANNEAGQRGMEVPDFGSATDRAWPEPEKGFASMVERIDHDVGRVLARLDELGIARDTAVFFTSDNGPHSEGGHDSAFFDSNGALRGQKRDLTEGGIRVPLIVRWPGVTPQGRVSDHVGGFQDVLPTLAEIASGNEHVPAGLDGISFAPTLRGSPVEQPAHESLYWAFYERGGGQAVRFGRWKAIEQPIGTPLRLYDLDKDAGESSDIAAARPDELARARTLFREAHTPSERWKFPARPRREAAGASR